MPVAQCCGVATETDPEKKTGLEKIEITVQDNLLQTNSLVISLPVICLPLAGERFVMNHFL